MRSLFLHDDSDLHAAIPGGVQLCTREFLAIVQAASSATVPFAIARSRSPRLRLRRRLRLGSYLDYDPAALSPVLARAIAEFRPTHIFLNRAELIRFAPVLKRLAPHASVVVMSHGNQSGDDLYELAGPHGRRTRGVGRLGAVWKLGLDLTTEAWHRHRFIDAVAVMSVEEATLERWLGAPRTVVLPRLITAAPLAWRPISGRCGYVGTLDHTPNRVALEEVCAALRQRGGPMPELRLVGSPATAGAALAQRFPFVTYLGRLDDRELLAEAASWSLFLNPVLWLSRGASMKLGVALAWEIPVLTTRAGARGYEWLEGRVPTCDDSAMAFVTELSGLLADPAALRLAKSASERASATSPHLDQLAARLRQAVA